MSDTVVLVRHIAGESVYETTTFVTEDKTGHLLVYADSSKSELVAVYNASGWFSVDFIEKEVDDVASADAMEAERTV